MRVGMCALDGELCRGLQCPLQVVDLTRFRGPFGEAKTEPRHKAKHTYGGNGHLHKAKQMVRHLELN